MFGIYRQKLCPLCLCEMEVDYEEPDGSYVWWCECCHWFERANIQKAKK